MSSLIKILNKINNIIVSSDQKNTQKLTKMTLSAGAKTFENLKLERYRSNIATT